MKVWGVLSADAENHGFDTVLDDQENILLQNKRGVLACFDPSDYTLPELRREITAEMQKEYDRLRLGVYQFCWPPGAKCQKNRSTGKDPTSAVHSTI